MTELTVTAKAIPTIVGEMYGSLAIFLEKFLSIKEAMSFRYS